MSTSDNMKHVHTFDDFLNESFESTYEEWSKMLKSNGYEFLGEHSYDEHWAKKYDHGVVIIEIYEDRKVKNAYQWILYFMPYVKIEKKFLGLLKTRLSPKSSDIASGTFDFGEGLFAVDDKKVLDNFDRLLKTVDKRVLNIDPEWFPASDNENIYKKEFWSLSKSGVAPSKLLFKDPKDYKEVI